MTEDKKTLSEQYLTFNLQKELYGLDIDSVREVLEVTQITKVPQTQEYMRGVINVRGHAVPVVDLRLKFGLEQGEMTVDTCIIIVEVRIDGESIILGLLVDGVEEVLELGQDNIEPPPRFGTRINSRFMKGIGKLDEKFIIILDIQEVFSEDELSDIAGTQSEYRKEESPETEMENA